MQRYAGQSGIESEAEALGAQAFGQGHQQPRPGNFCPRTVVVGVVEVFCPGRPIPLLDRVELGLQVSGRVVHVGVAALVPEVAAVQRQAQLRPLAPEQSARESVAQGQRVVPAPDRGGQGQAVGAQNIQPAFLGGLYRRVYGRRLCF